MSIETPVKVCKSFYGHFHQLLLITFSIIFVHTNSHKANNLWTIPQQIRVRCIYLFINYNIANNVLLKSIYFTQVNHLPGTGFITVKNELATSELRWVLPAFTIPKDREKFKLSVSDTFLFTNINNKQFEESL